MRSWKHSWRKRFWRACRRGIWPVSRKSTWATNMTGSDIQTVFLSGADATLSEARQGQCLPPSAQKGTRDVFQGPKWDFLCAQRKRRSNRLLCLEGPLGSTISLRGSDHREGFGFLTHLLSVRPDLLDCVAYDESH